MTTEIACSLCNQILEEDTINISKLNTSFTSKSSLIHVNEIR